MQKRNKKRNPIAVQLKHFKHKVIKNKKNTTEGRNMNDQLFRTLLKRYEATIEDCMYKIQSLSENNIIIPEHVDITGEADKLLQTMAEAEDKVAIMRKYYVQNKADKQVL